jgi:membrane-associated phospholipid phosphatase
MSFWPLVSRFGESTWLLPGAMLIALWLYHRSMPATALRWLAATAMTSALTLITKVAFMGWGVGIAAWDFTGISGHSAMSAAVLPVLLYLCAPASRPRMARLAAVCGIGLALLIGWSRLELQAHSPSEVVSGVVLGLAVSVAFLSWPGPKGLPRSVAPLAAALVVFTALHALPIPGASTGAHRLVVSMATFLSGRDQPFQRGL